MSSNREEPRGRRSLEGMGAAEGARNVYNATAVAFRFIGISGLAL
jgi:hypothetical protein